MEMTPAQEARERIHAKDEAKQHVVELLPIIHKRLDALDAKVRRAAWTQLKDYSNTQRYNDLTPEERERRRAESDRSRREFLLKRGVIAPESEAAS